MSKSIFSRRHYQQIASVLAETNNGQDPAANARWIIIREALIELFKEDNSNFNEYKFKLATEAEVA